MKRNALIAGLALATASAFVAPMASAECDISQTKCALNDGKCNIKFRNQTGISSGSGGGTKLDQTSSAQIIRVKAAKENGKPAGNVLTIEAGTSKSLNLDKKAKKDFARIRISSPTLASVEGVTITCAQVQTILDGSGTCKIFHGTPPYGDEKFDYQLGFSCDGGNVKGPK